MIVATAGHVDHGKSTLVRLMTGTDPDRWVEEKRRGLTIDLGFAQLRRNGVDLSFVDVPGHQRYLSNMLAGCGSIDVALLAISAREGWMPKTEEHLQIIDLLGVRRGVVALTHTDTVDDETTEIRLHEVRAHLQATVLADARILPTVPNVPASIEALEDALVSVARDVDQSGRQDRPSDRLRLWIDRSFTVAGAGSVVTGTVDGGSLSVGDAVSLYESGEPTPVRVRSIHVFGEAVDHARAGMRAGVALAGMKVLPRRGCALARAEEWTVGRRWNVAIETVRGIDRPLPSRGGYQVFLGTTHAPAQLRYGSDPVRLPGRLRGGLGPTLARLHLSVPVGPVSIGDRFILRDEGADRTVGGGTILAVDARPARYRSAELAERWKAVDGTLWPGSGSLASVLVKQRGGVVAASELCRQVGPLDLTRGSLHGARRLHVAHRHVVVFETFTRRRDSLRQRLHAGVSLPMPTDRIGVVAASSLVEDHQAEIRDGMLVQPGSNSYRVELEIALEAIRAAIDVADHVLCKPDDIRDATGLGSRPQTELIRSGDLVAVGPFVTTSEHFDDLLGAVEQILDEGPSTVSRIRTSLGLPRRLVLPLLEAMDSSGYCIREGDLRRWVGR